MPFFDDDGGVIVRPTILNHATHARLNAERATLRCFHGRTIAEIVAARTQDPRGQALAKRAQPAVVVIDRQAYPARSHLHSFLRLLWACYFKENLADLTLAARYDAFADQPPGQRRYIARRSDAYPPEGLNRLSDAAAIAALVGGLLLEPPFEELLTRVEPTPEQNRIYTWGYTGGSLATLEYYINTLGAVVIDVRESTHARVPQWRGDALAAQLGERYIYWPDLGNDHQLGDGQVQLHNPAIVVEDARMLLGTGPIILLCACREDRTCHRTAAARYLAMWLNAQIEHLPVRESLWVRA